MIRHGETEANRQEIVQGQLDTELNDAGIGQAEMVAAALKEIPFDLAYTSDLSRAAKVRGPPLQVIDDAVVTRLCRRRR